MSVTEVRITPPSGSLSLVGAAPLVELGVSAMIARLEEQKDAIQAAIEALKRLESLGGGATGLTGIGAPPNHRGIQQDTFVGMSIADAAPKYLEIVGRPARSTEEIVQALLRGGLQRVSPGSVATILIRVHNANGPVVRVQKGLWGLAEWYPKRPPRATRKSEEKETVPVKRRGRPPKKRPSAVEEEPKPKRPGRLRRSPPRRLSTPNAEEPETER